MKLNLTKIIKICIFKFFKKSRLKMTQIKRKKKTYKLIGHNTGIEKEFLTKRTILPKFQGDRRYLGDSEQFIGNKYTAIRINLLEIKTEQIQDINY